MAKSQMVPVNEKRRQIVFTSGDRLDLHNVTAFDPSGTWLRIWSDEGITILNPDLILYHQIKEPRQDALREEQRNPVDECSITLLGNQVDAKFDSMYGSDGKPK